MGQGAALGAGSGTMSLAWDPVPGAQGYRVYYGLDSDQYDKVVDVGPSTQSTLTKLQDCATHYVAVKAYNKAGESVDFSNQVSGWARTRVQGAVPVFTQGGQHVLVLTGANFEPQAELLFDADAVDEEGNPLIAASSVSVESCGTLEALIAVEPGARGARAMEIGGHTLVVRNPDGVFGAGPYVVELAQERMDINQSDDETANRVDGKDLVWLAYSYGADEGDERFNADADLTGDGMVDGEDLAWLATVYGSCWDGSDWSEEGCP
jgi:hypothetical protein